MSPAERATQGQRQFRLDTSLLGVGGIAFGLAVGRDSGWVNGTLAGCSAWIVIGLLQQARDIWSGRTLFASRELFRGWLFCIGWRIFIVMSIGAFWLLDSLEGASWISFTVDDSEFLQDSPWQMRDGWFYLSLIVGLFAAPWNWRNSPRTVVGWILDILGAVAGFYLAFLVLKSAAMIPALVHISIRGVEAAQPHKFAGVILYDMDVLGVVRRTRLLGIASYGMVALSFVNVCLVSLLARRVRRAWLIAAMLLTGIAVSGAYAFWVHVHGLDGVSTFLAQSQRVRPWPWWLFTFLLLSLFAVTASYRLSFRFANEDIEPFISWHRGAGAYLHESRILNFALAITLLSALFEIESFQEFFELDTWKFGIWVFDEPGYYYMQLALFWLSVSSACARRRHVDLDRRAMPIPLSPSLLVVVSILVAAVTMGLVEAVMWASFAWCVQ